jgi:hypothetical protein
LEISLFDFTPEFAKAAKARLDNWMKKLAAWQKKRPREKEKRQSEVYTPQHQENPLPKYSSVLGR